MSRPQNPKLPSTVKFKKTILKKYFSRINISLRTPYLLPSDFDKICSKVYKYTSYTRYRNGLCSFCDFKMAAVSNIKNVLIICSLQLLLAKMIALYIALVML